MGTDGWQMVGEIREAQGCKDEDSDGVLWEI